jgi:hypothetical protein
MKKWISLAALACAALVFVAVSAAAAPPSSKGPYTVTTTDGGCGGNQWANDTITRTFDVKHGSTDGTYRVKRTDRGSFTTIAGMSPGNCASNTSAHGTAVVAGITGRINGYLQGVVTGGTYDPNATCTGDCAAGVTSAWVAAYFGPSAQYSCLTGSGACSFEFHYTAPGQHLKYRHWIDKGTESSETFTGDIASS